MTLTLSSNYSNSSGCTGANSYAEEIWNGELGAKHFTVQLNSMSTPVWSGDELDDDERTDVINELAERSGL